MLQVYEAHILELGQNLIVDDNDFKDVGHFQADTAIIPVLSATLHAADFDITNAGTVATTNLHVGKLGNNIAGVTGSEQLTNVHEISGDELSVTTATVTSGHIGRLTSALDADASDISGVNHFEADTINTALSASLNAGGFDIDNINTLAAATANIGQLATDLDGTPTPTPHHHAAPPYNTFQLQPS